MLPASLACSASALSWQVEQNTLPLRCLYSLIERSICTPQLQQGNRGLIGSAARWLTHQGRIANISLSKVTPVGPNSRVKIPPVAS